MGGFPWQGAREKLEEAAALRLISHEVVWQKSIPTQICLIILYISHSEGCVDGFVGELTLVGAGGTREAGGGGGPAVDSAGKVNHALVDMLAKLTCYGKVDMLTKLTCYAKLLSAGAAREAAAGGVPTAGRPPPLIETAPAHQITPRK